MAAQVFAYAADVRDLMTDIIKVLDGLWLIKKATIKSLKDILRLSGCKASGEAVENDISFCENADPAEFRCNSLQAQAVGNQLLLQFYKILTSRTGFQNSLDNG